MPEFFKRKKFGRVKILCFGKYELKVNGLTARDSFKHLQEKESDLYNELHTITLQNVGKSYLKLEQLSNNKIEIVGISSEITGYEQGEDE